MLKQERNKHKLLTQQVGRTLLSKTSLNAGALTFYLIGTKEPKPHKTAPDHKGVQIPHNILKGIHFYAYNICVVCTKMQWKNVTKRTPFHCAYPNIPTKALLNEI